MENQYKMVTVQDYLKLLDGAKCTSISENEISKQVEKYLLSVKRKEENAKIVETLLR